MDRAFSALPCNKSYTLGRYPRLEMIGRLQRSTLLARLSTQRPDFVGGARQVRTPPVVAINKCESAKTGCAKTGDISSKLVRMAPFDAFNR